MKRWDWSKRCEARMPPGEGHTVGAQCGMPSNHHGVSHTLLVPSQAAWSAANRAHRRGGETRQEQTK